MTQINITCGACGKTISLLVVNGDVVGESPAEPKLLDMHIDKLDLTARAYNILAGANILYVRQLVGFTRAELWRMKYMGKRSLDEIETELARHGLTLKASPEINVTGKEA